MRTKINEDFQSVQFSWIVARMCAVARDKKRAREDRLEELSELGATLVSMAKVITEHWKGILETLEG